MEEKWSSEYEELILKIKKKREETKRKRDNPFTSFTMHIIKKVLAKTLAFDIVSVKPMSSPNINFSWFNYESEEDRRKREIYEKRKKIVDELLKNNI